MPSSSPRDLLPPPYLDDFRVGEVTRTATVEVTSDMIRSFAEVYDPQPMHLDDIAARDTVFGELVGSGWQTLALTMRLLVDARLLGGLPIVGAEFKEMRFHRSMRPGDWLQASAEIVGLRPSKRPGRGFVDLKVTTETTSGAVLVTQTWALVVPARTSEGV